MSPSKATCGLILLELDELLTFPAYCDVFRLPVVGCAIVGTKIIMGNVVKFSVLNAQQYPYSFHSLYH
jgi:hypothetical protein